MLKSRNTWIAAVGTLVVVAVGVVAYNSLFINLFGFHIRKNKIQDVIVYSHSHAYYIQNSQLVQQISEDLASLHRSSNITQIRHDVYAPIPKVLVQTQNHSTYGGSIWAEGSMVDANGHYWTMTPQLLHLLARSIQDNQTKEMYQIGDRPGNLFNYWVV